MTWKWGNIPIPEAHVAGLAVKALLTVLWPQATFANRWIGIFFGELLVMAGAALDGWAVGEASDMAIDSPDRLLMCGPYALSGNPMDVA